MLRKLVHLTEMLRNERRPLAQLQARQQALLTRLVRHAARNVPGYRRLWRASGIDPDEPVTPETFVSLPIIDKNRIQEMGRELFIDERLRGAERAPTHSTSGSSGVPFDFVVANAHDQWRKAQYLRPYLTNGRRFRDRVLRLTAFPNGKSKWFSGLGLLRETCVDCAADPAELERRLLSSRPEIIQGYPSALRSLASRWPGIADRVRPPRLIFSDSELLTGELRRLLNERLGVDPIDIFGTYETDNIAYQCAQRASYHVAMDCVVLEVVRDGRPVPVGESGELVVTVLRSYAMPFIRYNLHDIGSLSREPCGCGRSFPLLEVIDGRSDDQVLLANGTRCSPLGMLGRFDRFSDMAREYQIVQTAVDRFEVRVVPSARLDGDSIRRLAVAVEHEFPQASATVRSMQSIPREPSGKLKAFVCAAG